MRPFDTFLALLVATVINTANTATVTIQAGTIKGGICSTDVNTASFKGIPYAEPPIDDLRFASPKEHSGKYPNGELDATESPLSCIQFGTGFSASGPTSEDCLYLNVWAPANATPSSGLPVRVWLYGGGNVEGGISMPLYDGCAVPSTGAVMVAINYRLGPLGFLALDGAGFLGNQGIEDALIGLTWVQDNIRAFGGDPSKVVLHGQSAGALDSFTVATLAQAPNLISAAIFQSGGGLELLTRETIESVSAGFARATGCSSADKSCLRKRSVRDITAAMSNITIPPSNGLPELTGFQPFVDGKLIPTQPSRQGVRVPSIFGSNSMEGTFLALSCAKSPAGFAGVTPDLYHAFLQQTFGDQTPKIKQQYPVSAFKSTPYPALSAISAVLTAWSFTCPSRRALQLAAENGVPVWAYRFSHHPQCSWHPVIAPDQLPILGATHTAEVPFVFGEVSHLPWPNGTCDMTNAEKKISGFMMDAWTSMALKQKPGEHSQWPVWTDATSSLGIVFDEVPTNGIVDFTECVLWDELYHLALVQSYSNDSMAASPSVAVMSGTTRTTPFWRSESWALVWWIANTWLVSSIGSL